MKPIIAGVGHVPTPSFAPACVALLALDGALLAAIGPAGDATSEALAQFLADALTVLSYPGFVGIEWGLRANNEGTPLYVVALVYRRGNLTTGYEAEATTLDEALRLAAQRIRVRGGAA